LGFDVGEAEATGVTSGLALSDTVSFLSLLEGVIDESRESAYVVVCDGWGWCWWQFRVFAVLFGWVGFFFVESEGAEGFLSFDLIDGPAIGAACFRWAAVEDYCAV
jgi:hypothetical protein